ncbi:Hypothetical_protein [Hexamita inflata]|uniref:Hypothetical_protein n=1 Tax=Hexamita inflata TaxID=28002 RepID=A0AA86R8M9_9EUKA|nr:Hypothetical protein HINF_LOCUS60410 [Hexamita inflata]
MPAQRPFRLSSTSLQSWQEQPAGLKKKNRLVARCDQYNNNFAGGKRLFHPGPTTRREGHYFNVQNRKQSLEEEKQVLGDSANQITTAAAQLLKKGWRNARGAREP